MANLDMERAKKLLKSAKDLLRAKDVSGVAGLAYQAFESAAIALLKIKNGYDQKSHYGRRNRAKELLTEFRDNIDYLWDIRNIDFYGNISLGSEEEEIDMKKVEESLQVVENIIIEIKKFVVNND
jgi:HEPN domain-containing protein